MLALLVAFAACDARADWPAGGKLVSSPGDINGVRNALILPSPSGDLFVVGQGTAGSSCTYDFQRVSVDGFIAPGWPADGVRMSSVIRGCRLQMQGFAVDDQSRIWRTWSYSHTYVQTLSGDAVPSPPLPQAFAYDLGVSGSLVARAAPAPGGEMFIASNGRLQRLTSSGVAATGWPGTGVVLPALAADDHDVLPDGAGGALVFMRFGNATGAPIAIRFDGDGIRHAGWPASGLDLSALAIVVPDVNRADSRLLSSGPGHALAFWTLDAGSGMRRAMLQRFGLDATLDPAWPANGLEVVPPGVFVSCRAIPDGSGGAYVIRESNGTLLGTHVLADGTILGNANTTLLDAAAQYVPTLQQSTPDPAELAADVTPDGDLLVAWNDTRLSPAQTFRLRWMTPSLTPAALNPDTALVYFPGSPHPFHGALLTVKADGHDGAYLAWGDYHFISEFQVYGDLWMTRVQASALLDVEPGPASRTLSLSAARPNPARTLVAFRLALPDEAAARLELLDVAGRVRRSQLVQGAGAHTVTFDRLGALEPGLYLARLTGRGGASVVRVVVTR